MLVCLQSIGARFEYDMIKEGNEYICYHGGVEIRVCAGRCSLQSACSQLVPHM